MADLNFAETRRVENRYHDGESSAAAALDNLCALWVDQAPRFGAVATHFPGSLRKRRFVAGFWAPEVLLFGDFYLEGFTRAWCDEICALLVERAPAAGKVVTVSWLPMVAAEMLHAPGFGVWQDVDTGKPRFWSPELPEIAWDGPCVFGLRKRIIVRRVSHA